MHNMILSSIRIFLLFSCILFLSCEEHGFWEKREGDCNPSQQLVLKSARLWSSTFGDKGAHGCMRIAWGSALDQSTGLYIQLDSSGKVLAYDPVTKSFGESIQYTVPLNARQNPRSFNVYIFGEGLKPEQRQAHCEDKMAKADYTCQAEEKGACWFSFGFQPKPASPGLIAKAVPSGCIWTLPKSTLEEKQQPEKEVFIQEEHFQQDSGETNPKDQQESIPEPSPELPIEQPVEAQQVKPTPTAPWGQHLGNTTGANRSRGIAVAPNGDVYIAGFFSGNSQFGKTSLTSKGKSDAFVAKLDYKGQWIWAKQIGGSNDCFAHRVAVDRMGNAFVTGYFKGQVSSGTRQLTAKGDSEIFLAKWDTNGNLLWAVQSQSNTSTVAHDLAVDNKGNAVVTGYYSSKFVLDQTVLNASFGSADIFVLKMSTKGQVIWALSAGGSDLEVGFGLAVDASDNVLVTGFFRGQSQFGPTQLNSKGEGDLFVTKISPSGKWLWAKQAGDSKRDSGAELAADPAGNIFVTGFFFGKPSFGKTTLTAKGQADTFVAKMDKDGNWLWAVHGAGPAAETGYDIIANEKGEVTVTGTFARQIQFGLSTIKSKGREDIFVVKIGPQGKPINIQQAGGAGGDGARGIALGPNGARFVTGNFAGKASFAGKELTPKGKSDLFIWKIE